MWLGFFFFGYMLKSDSKARWCRWMFHISSTRKTRTSNQDRKRRRKKILLLNVEVAFRSDEDTEEVTSDDDDEVVLRDGFIFISNDLHAVCVSFGAGVVWVCKTFEVFWNNICTKIGEGGIRCLWGWVDFVVCIKNKLSTRMIVFKI